MAGVAACLRALKPLLAPLTIVALRGADEWGEALVRVLGEVLPRTCTSLALRGGRASGGGLEQAAASLPWLRCLRLEGQGVRPEDVFALVSAVKRANLGKEGEGNEARVELEEVVVKQPGPGVGVSEATHRAAWEEAVGKVGRMRAGVALRLVW